MSVKAKKHLGQHFLTDPTVCVRIADHVANNSADFDQVLEVGPGMGALTKYLLEKKEFTTHVIELDGESVVYLHQHYPEMEKRIYGMDFLKQPLDTLMDQKKFAVVGNFPYNISSQILFKVLDYRDQVPLVVGMFQKEVAERVAEKPGSKKYGIISVLLQAYYDIEYLFTVPPTVFIPPPKVDSGVIVLKRNDVKKLPCNEKLFKTIVKQAFNQRRKTLRNSLKTFVKGTNKDMTPYTELLGKRPETLSVADFVALTALFDE